MPRSILKVAENNYAAKPNTKIRLPAPKVTALNNQKTAGLTSGDPLRNIESTSIFGRGVIDSTGAKAWDVSLKTRALANASRYDRLTGAAAILLFAVALVVYQNLWR
jgi:hypothetical protein